MDSSSASSSSKAPSYRAPRASWNDCNMDSLAILLEIVAGESGTAVCFDKTTRTFLYASNKNQDAPLLNNLIKSFQELATRAQAISQTDYQDINEKLEDLNFLRQHREALLGQLINAISYRGNKFPPKLFGNAFRFVTNSLMLTYLNPGSQYAFPLDIAQALQLPQTFIKLDGPVEEHAEYKLMYELYNRYQAWQKSSSDSIASSNETEAKTPNWYIGISKAPCLTCNAGLEAGCAAVHLPIRTMGDHSTHFFPAQQIPRILIESEVIRAEFLRKTNTDKYLSAGGKKSSVKDVFYGSSKLIQESRQRAHDTDGTEMRKRAVERDDRESSISDPNNVILGSSITSSALGTGSGNVPQPSYTSVPVPAPKAPSFVPSTKSFADLFKSSAASSPAPSSIPAPTTIATSSALGTGAGSTPSASRSQADISAQHLTSAPYMSFATAKLSTQKAKSTSTPAVQTSSASTNRPSSQVPNFTPPTQQSTVFVNNSGQGTGNADTSDDAEFTLVTNSKRNKRGGKSK